MRHLTLGIDDICRPIPSIGISKAMIVRVQMGEEHGDLLAVRAADVFGDPISVQERWTDVEIGHRTASLCQLLVITRQVGRRVKWDPEKEAFLGDEEANLLLDRPRRKGWELPT